jgi:hypothetical protein
MVSQKSMKTVTLVGSEANVVNHILLEVVEWIGMI